MQAFKPHDETEQMLNKGREDKSVEDGKVTGQSESLIEQPDTKEAKSKKKRKKTKKRKKAATEDEEKQQSANEAGEEASGAYTPPPSDDAAAEGKEASEASWSTLSDDATGKKVQSPNPRSVKRPLKPAGAGHLIEEKQPSWRKNKNRPPASPKESPEPDGESQGSRQVGATILLLLNQANLIGNTNE